MKKKQDDGRRKARVEKEVQSCVAKYLLSGYIKAELPGLVTVAAVRMPADFRSARVYISFFGASQDERKAAMKLLERRSPEIQSYIGSELKMRYCPVLKFFPDEETERILKIEKILSDINKADTDSHSAL